jgi:hypothetical protein
MKARKPNNLEAFQNVMGENLFAVERSLKADEARLYVAAYGRAI